MPRYHPISGHMVAMKQSARLLPRKTTVHVIISQILKQFPTGIFYLNLWPFSRTILVVTNPFAAFQLLEALAKKREMFQLEEHTLRLTFDVITWVTLDARLHCQTQGNRFVECLRRQNNWTPYSAALNPFRILSPWPLVQKYNNYHMDKYLDNEIDKRFQELYVCRKGDSAEPQAWSRSAISLAMDQYLEGEGNDNRGELSKRSFKELVKPQPRMFLYAGRDTTSSTLMYCYHLLSRHPLEMAKVRAEHDKVCGTDNISPESCRKSIAADPTLLNRIPYTVAVIKEVLRIFPAAGSSREGRSDLVLTDEEGYRYYPTEGCNNFTLNLAMHHNAKNLIDPAKIIPGRWLVGPQDPLHLKKRGSWRAFEWGTRNCIGQTLAQLELKVALVMTARVFDITPSYDEWDKLHPSKGI
ncbi:P450 monooxygenase AflN [Hypoxylon sp. FL1150]|nr:P450 monooxygenase AflN [Hypoxylon sp. FL1150]